MKIYISADGEGISGAVSTDEMHQTGKDYEQFRHWMTNDVNAAIRGAFDAGATEVVVNDSHWNMTNIIFEKLDPRAEIIRGWNKDLGMMEGIEDCDGALLVGYHAKVGHSDGVANETMLGFEMYEMRMNGEAVGEMEINAALAGNFGIPIIMVSGDDCFAREAREYFGDVETAVVKYAIDRWTARCVSMETAHKRIHESAFNAVKRVKDFTPKQYAGPIELEIEWTSSSECKKASLVPGSYRKSPRIVAYKGNNIMEAWRGIWACLNLGWSASNHIYG